MLLRNRPPAIDTAPAPGAKLVDHLDDSALAVLRWLDANRVDCVLVGSVARAIRGEAAGRGPVDIVPAPYGRNLDRLARALNAGRARVRLDGELAGPGIDPVAGGSAAVKLTADKLLGPERWTLCCGRHDIDIEGWPAGAPRYQELLYEAARIAVAEGVDAQVAAPADIEHYEHLRRTGLPPEVRVIRAARAPAT